MTANWQQLFKSHVTQCCTNHCKHEQRDGGHVQVLVREELPGQFKNHRLVTCVRVESEECERRLGVGLVLTYPCASGSLVGGLETSRLLEDQLLQLLLREVVQLHGESEGLLGHRLQARSTQRNISDAAREQQAKIIQQI